MKLRQATLPLLTASSAFSSAGRTSRDLSTVCPYPPTDSAILPKSGVGERSVISEKFVLVRLYERRR
ncbi:MAG TPA: hypothetical protein VKF36_00775 [Syntrophorhabdales bacterium]|nr:hypothetical protein [Syntrophorhabdales bacterium]